MRAIRRAPETIGGVVIIAIAICALGFQNYRERLAYLNEWLASQDRLLDEYRTKLAQAGTQTEKLTAALADAESLPIG